MISVVLFRDQHNKIVRFTMKGHAGYAESGADIVCAAATTAAMTAVNGLTDVAQIAMNPKVSAGFLDCTLPSKLSDNERHDADVILESLLLTFINLAEQYPAYFSMREK